MEGCTYEEIPNLDRSPEPRLSHVAISKDNNLYVYGGFGKNNEQYRQHIWVYDSDKNSWKQCITTGDIPDHVCGSRTTVINDSIYLFGGHNNVNKQYSNDIYNLNLDTLQWNVIETTGEKPSQRHFHVQWCTTTGFIVFGGSDGGGRSFNDTFHFNINTMKWTQPAITGTPPTRRYASSFSQRGYEEGYLFGGSGNNFNKFNDLHVFHLTTNTWREIIPSGPSPPVRFGATMNVVRQHQLIVCGGWGGLGVGALSDCWLFDVERKEWKELKVNNFVARRFHTSSNIGDELLIFGGTGANYEQLGSLGRCSFF